MLLAGVVVGGWLWRSEREGESVDGVCAGGWGGVGAPCFAMPSCVQWAPWVRHLLFPHHLQPHLQLHLQPQPRPQSRHLSVCYKSPCLSMVSYTWAWRVLSQGGTSRVWPHVQVWLWAGVPVPALAPAPGMGSPVSTASSAMVPGRKWWYPSNTL